MKENKTTLNRIQELDSLRGIAALCVLLFHLTLQRVEANYGFFLGTTGVDLFFIISGFVIFKSLNTVTTSFEFIINRISRLYPTYWTCVTITFCLLIFSNGKYNNTLIVQYLLNLTMFQHYLNIPDLDGPYWTMIVEMTFYLIMLIFYRLKLLHKINIFGLSFSLVMVLLTHFFGYSPFIKNLFIIVPFLQFSPLFFSGICFYKLLSDKWNNYNYFFILIHFFCQVLMFKYVGRSRYYISQLDYFFMLSVFYILFILLVNKKLKFIVLKPLLFLGKISFALYLIHQFISSQILLPLLNKLKINFWISSFLIILPILLIISHLITIFIEIPIGKQIKKKLNHYIKFK